MKRYILDEVATYEEATRVPETSVMRYAAWNSDGEIMGCGPKPPDTKLLTWLKLTVLEGTPEQIAEQMMKLAVEVVS